MAAKLYLLRLYRGCLRVGDEVKEYLDPTVDDRLRELFIARVTAVAGTTQVRLDQGWELHVLGLNGGPRHARITVDHAGRTVIRR